MTRRTFIKRGLAATAFLGGGSLAYAGEFERHGIEFSTVPLRLGLSRPLRVALLADLHFDPLYETAWLGEIFRLVAAREPDIVLMAGDFVTRTTERFEEFGPLAATMRAPFGMFAALGNHDHWSDRWESRTGGTRKIGRVFAANGIRLLRNTAIPLPMNPGWVLAGTESAWAGKPDPALFSRYPADTRFIAIVHEPDAWDVVNDPRIRLQVSGHTHGGQVRAPIYGALALPSWGRKYDAGLFTRGERNLYVNRGIGTVGVPFRVNCAPEVTILELS